MEYKKVDGHEGLYRDPYNNAIIMMDESTAEKARAAKAARKKQMQEQEELKEKVNDLAADMNEIKTLLKTMVGKNG